MVECQLPKLDVAGSNPVSRSINQQLARNLAIWIPVAPIKIPIKTRWQLRPKRPLVKFRRWFDYQSPAGSRNRF